MSINPLTLTGFGELESFLGGRNPSWPISVAQTVSIVVKTSSMNDRLAASFDTVTQFTQ